MRSLKKYVRAPSLFHCDWVSTFFLYRIFSSGQSIAFNELMRRVQPQQDVKAVRDEIKVRKIERIGGNLTGVSHSVLFVA